MIYDTIESIGIYRSSIPNLDAVREFLASDLAALPDGKVAIDGDRVFATISTYGTKRLEDGVFEAHSRYADIQLLLDGEELCGVVPGADWLKETIAYDPARDIRFFASPPSFARITLSSGLFAFFGARDAHMPGIAVGAMGRVRKCVIKTLI
ncbi:MAG: YhcH/YjgK/YiaL family protein [Kiritimatiellae bacterium]|nr:YhcH/YjgK/YiaL family protein [Kiritimatiellia bacterium]